MFILCLAGTAWAQTLEGVNLAGAAFSPDKLPGVYGQDFVYPNADEIAYFADKGMNVFRISVLWERLQPALNGPLDPAELGRLGGIIAAARQHNASVIIDVHNYGRYRGTEIGQYPVTGAAFANLWIQLARRFSHDHNVLFGLMNEPQLNQAAAWKLAVQQAIDGIRSAGADNRILISGTQWDSAAGFATISGNTLGRLHDTHHRLVFEVHEYFDTDSSGTSDTCVSQDRAIARLTSFTQWLHENKQEGFLGEFGTSGRPDCLALLAGVLFYLKANADVWSGWTYWAAGPAWGSYMFSIEPDQGKDRPQMLLLEKYLNAQSHQMKPPSH
jgi:endoglucanase